MNSTITDDRYREALTKSLNGLGILLTEIPESQFGADELATYRVGLAHLALRISET